MSQSLTFKTDMDFAYGVPTEIRPGIRRIVANNGGPLTFHGTNTYLIGSDSLAVIDPGPDEGDHLNALLEAAGQAKITHILITHRHRDHVAGTHALQAATGAKTYAFAAARDLRGMTPLKPTGQEFIDTNLIPDFELKHGDTIQVGDWHVTTIHTPGHAPDHLCFAIDQFNILFSGDHVMSWNTSVIAPPEGKMAHYIASLEGLLERNDELFLPGHGGRLERPQRVVRAYLLHRKLREQSILDAIRNGSSTISSLASEIYSSVPDAVAGAAALSVLAHVELLHERGLVRCDSTLGLESQFYPT